MEKLQVIRTLKEMVALSAELNNVEFVAFDTETTGVAKESKIIGFSISTSIDTGVYIVLSYWDVETKSLIDLETCEFAKEFLQMLSKKSLIMHNGIFDCAMVENNYGIKLMPSLHTDTMILSHLLDENRSNGLKDLGTSIFGESAKEEQKLMKESVAKNGGLLTKADYEMYKADSELIARYGAKDALLTLKLFYHLVEDLYAQGLEDFFYKDESMPLLRGPTYDLNTVGLKVDADALAVLRGTLEAECMQAKAFIYSEITALVQPEYKKKPFNIGSGKQLAWLLFIKLGNEFGTLTKEGRNLCHELGLKLPYAPNTKREFIRFCIANKGNVYKEAEYNPKTKKIGRPKKVSDPWNYIAADKNTLGMYAKKYKWVETFLEYTKNLKLLNTYVIGMQEKLQYGIIHPSFLQHGTTSGRYSSRAPNFQNLPRKDTRIKSCIVARPGKTFVGADYSQLEPRVFASYSQDERLLRCFESGDDFYSVIGMEVFNKSDCSAIKDDNNPNCFANKYKHLRDLSKVIALSATYGTTASKMAPAIGKSMQEAKEIIENYFETFPKVHELMLKSHAMAKESGIVTNLYGRPRRMAKAKLIPKLFGTTAHGDLQYEYRNLLNLAVNHRIQSTGASIMNRAAIAFHKALEDYNIKDCHIVMQVHDEIIAECKESDAEAVAFILKDCMENTVSLPGVKLLTEPKINKKLSGLK